MPGMTKGMVPEGTVSATVESVGAETGSSIPSVHATPGLLQVIKRNGALLSYDETKVAVAITKAFLAVEGEAAASSARVRELVEQLSEQILATFMRRLPSGSALDIEEVQDQVELALMRGAHHQVARRYVLYREERANARKQQFEVREQAQREQQGDGEAPPAEGSVEEPAQWLDDGQDGRRPLEVVDARGQRQVLGRAALAACLQEACDGLEDTSPDLLLERVLREIHDGMEEANLVEAMIISARPLVEQESNYSYVAARLRLSQLRREVLVALDLEGELLAAQPQSSNPLSASFGGVGQQQMAALYPAALAAFVERGIELQRLSPELRAFDLQQLGQELAPERDLQFTIFGLQTLYDRYFLQDAADRRIELPQLFLMRVAMGLALHEKEEERTARAAEFYHLLSSFDHMCSTPTLFNSGTRHPQLSSCFLSTVPDDLDGIFGAIRDNALLSKWAGGLGNDWTPVRAIGARIAGTNGRSGGIIPFLKVANDTAVAVDQGGKRLGALCAYLEPWHLDVESFLELRKNTGDERRRTHDIFTALWMPDLFLERVAAKADWTLFSPEEVSDLHDLCGLAFKRRYLEYEACAERGEMGQYRKLPAEELWRKIMTQLFETGTPWVTFKDSCNLRSPQQHCGVVHSSNLCTEITLNTSAEAGAEEIAVCNLGSLNLANHLCASKSDEAALVLDIEKLERTVTTAVRMLDNVIDINYYAVSSAQHSNSRHRPVGLGMMGFQDALLRQRIPYASTAAVEFADRAMEVISYFAIRASSELALERGAYDSFEGSLWSRGILPIDSMELLRDQRAEGQLEVDTSQTMDWDSLRERVIKQGMRNSNVMAIAPTATIANIVGVSPSIEPTFSNLYVVSNLSGQYTVLNPYMVRELKSLGLWDEVMINDLKFYEGSLRKIDRVPEALRTLYATAHEVSPQWLIEAAARRQKWIDQSQSLNLYVPKDISLNTLSLIYHNAWLAGIKTTYYLRSRGCDQLREGHGGSQRVECSRHRRR